MTGRRARGAHRPTAAVWWGTARYFLLLCAFTALGVALALIAGEWLWRGEWKVTYEAGGVGFLGVVFCALAAVAHAFLVDAVDGPPARIYRPSEDFPDDHEEIHDDEQSIEDAAREQGWCPTCESPSRAVKLLDEGDGLPCGDPMGWHSVGAS